LVATGLVNRKFMTSLGPELEGIVREEARKAETLFSTWGVEDLERIRKSWVGNGGEVYTMPSADAKRYLDDVTSVVEPILAKSPQLKEDYQALLAATKKYRK
jgi:C4-dicarboxylate-binding protein DctP